MMPATAPCRLLPFARTMRQSANDGGSARSRAFSTTASKRVGSISNSGVWMNTVAGLNRLMTAATLTATNPATSRNSACRSTAPDFASSITSSTCTARPSLRLACHARAESLATVSRHPVFPHPHRRPPSATAVKWPISPASPERPFRIRPPLMIPNPTPAPTSKSAKSFIPFARPWCRSARHSACDS